MGNSTLRACQELCRQAAVEQDPARLLSLFLQIDRLVDLGFPNSPRNDTTNGPSILSVVCPHCWAIIELPQPRTTVKLLCCPWCEGQFSMPTPIPGLQSDAA